jgi:hypothetical protein
VNIVRYNELTFVKIFEMIQSVRTGITENNENSGVILEKPGISAVAIFQCISRIPEKTGSGLCGYNHATVPPPKK